MPGVTKEQIQAAREADLFTYLQFHEPGVLKQDGPNFRHMAEYLPDECKGMVDHLEEQERPATIIKTLLKHAKIQVDQAAKAFEHASRQQVLGESR